MVLKKQVHVYCSFEKFNKFDEARFIEDFKEHNVCLLDAHKMVHDDHLVITMDFQNKFSCVPPLDPNVLTQVISKHLGEPIKIRIEAGGFETLEPRDQ